LEHQVKVDKNTRFNIASNAKQFTALCILKLVEAGKMSLEDDIRNYLPALFKGIEEKITIANLINHTSGIRDYCDLISLTGKVWWKQFIDNDDVIEMMAAQSGLNFKPGTAYGYSNSNYTLLTEVIKIVSGQEFSEFAKDMFEALDMPSTSYVTHYGMIIPYEARPYGNWGGWKEEPTITAVHGDGALYTNLSDQLQWEQIVRANDGKYLSKEIIQTSQAPIANSFTDTYGYGLMFDQHNGRDYTYHDGVTGAFNATFLRLPERISIVVMSGNRNVPANYLAWQIATKVLNFKEARYPENPEKTETLTDIQEVLGYYKGKSNGAIIKIVEKEGSLYREMQQRDPVKLIKEKDALFAYETIEGLKMNFRNIGQSEQQFTLYLSSQPPMTYQKLPNSVLQDFDGNDLNGRFYNAETETEIILKYQEGNTYSLTKNGREREAELILMDYLKMNSYEIKIIRDQSNNIIGLNVNYSRIGNVIFNKI
ncbi:MAG: serine hydrolase domain-containing protein, partial [Bacteroidota bacterium]